MNQSILAAFNLTAGTVHGADPLAFWNETAAKTAITAFFKGIARTDSLDFIPLAERIVLFDH